MKRRFTNFSSLKLSVTILSVMLFSVISFTKSMAQCPVGMGDLANMTIMGNYTGNGRDSIQIANATSHDTMTVTGDSDISNDTLDLFICSGFAPTNGMTITFWDSGTLTGTFSQVNILGTGSNLNNWTIRYDYPNLGEISAYYCGVSVSIMDLDGVELCVGTAFGFQAVRSPLATVVTNYNWTSTNLGGLFNPNNLNSASTTDFVAGTASVADSIIVEMVTNQGCSVFDTVEVTINPDIIVSITNNPSGVVPTEMCENGTLDLKGSGSGGNGTLNYSWQVFVNSVAANAANFFSVPNSNNNMTGMTTTLFSIPDGTITGITDIDIILNVTDATSCETSDTVNITVVPEPDVALVTPPASPVCSGIDDNVSFTVSNPNGFGDGFYWTVTYPMGVSGSGDGCTTGTTIADTVTNTTNASVVLTYNVYAYSEINMSDCDAGCVSVTGITVNVTILPEPVVADTTFTVCSDIAIAYNLPDLGDNGLDIDSFSITAVVDGDLTGSASSGNGITSLTELAADVFGNTTTTSQNVVYTVIPFSDGCAGDTFTITVIVNPEPVTDPALATSEVCSDLESGIVLNTIVTSVAAADWDIVSIDVAVGLVADGGNAIVNDGQASTALENDVFTNTTALPLDVVYVVVPVSADGCAGDTFTITLTINPEPVTNAALDSFEVCSDILANIVLSTNGTSVAADDWDIVSIDVAVGLTPDGGNAVVGDNQTSTALEDDVFTNTTSGPLNVEYQVVPVSADGCAGDTFTIVVVVNPEPVTSPGLELAMVCSDVNTGIVLTTNGTSVGADEWDIISITAEPGLTPAVGNATVGDGEADNYLENDVFTNITPNELEVVYVVVPVSADGCAGDTFNITLTVKPEPVVADQTATACSDTPIGVTLGNDVDGPSADTYDITSVDLNGLSPVSELAYSGNLTTGNQNFGQRLGMVFTTNAPVSVNQLGAFDSNQDGLNLPITVGIIRNSDQVVMAGPVTLSGTMEPLGADGRHRMTNIAPVVLAPDTYTIVAVGYGATELNGNSNLSPPGTTTNTGGGLLTFNSARFGGAGFGFPTTAFPTPDVFHAGTFQFESTSVGNGVLANAIVNDSYTNTTNAPVDVVYEVVPISADGCAGDTFTVTVTINPEPVTDPTLATATSCSDDSISVVLNTNGTSVSAETWDLISVVVDVDLTANGGNQAVADDLDEYAISGDSYTNITNAPQDVVYTVVPVSDDNCAGDTFQITVTINPEPVVADTSFTVCSNEAIGYNLPDLGDNALDIDSFEISANVDVDLGGTATEGTVTLLTAIASDVYTNVTNTTQDVVYSVIPYSDGCAGDTFDITVTINPEPVVADSTFTVCSDEPIGYDLPAVGDNGLGIDSFSVTAVAGPGLTGTPTVGNGLSGSAIAADDYNNITTTPDSVIYTITPYTGGCAGDSYDLTVIVNPEPVVADSSFSICSDVAIGYNLPDAGDNGLDIDSFGITAIVDMNLAGIPTVGTVTALNAIAADVYNNISMAPHMVVYTITPYTNGCAGDMYNLTVTVNPEPVGEDSTLTVCSDENFTYDPQGSIINQTSGMMIVDTIFYTGAMQTYTVPMSVTSITIEAFGGAGAAGANGNSVGGATMGGPGGAGGQAIGNLSVMPGQMLNVFVGGVGSTMGTGGFNGGGNGGSAISGGGGGATDVRYPGTSSGDRIIVAGGGGGGGRGGCESTTTITGGAGGVGGNGNGANGTDAPTSGGVAGGGFGGVGQIGGGAGIGCGGFLGSPGANGLVTGQGGNGGAGQSCCCFSFGSLPGGGGGGGGYVGGGGAGGGSAGTTGCSGNDKGGGGGGAGGSSYFGGVSGGSATNGVNSGDGYVIISYSLPLMSSTFDWEITDIAGTVTGSSVGDSGTGIIQDSMHNVSNTPAVVTYSIVPTSVPEGCVGDTFTFIVTVNPEPVVSDTAFSVCSDVAIGYNLPDLDDDGGDIDSFDITAVVGGGLTGTASQGNGVTDLTFIANDVFNNVTPNAIDVVYTVTPYFYGCAGEPYTVTVTIDAEPVVANQTVTVCSDVPLGINFNTDPNGPVVEYYTINSITTTLTASAGNPMVGDSFAIDSIANDAWTNLTNANQTVVYNVTPVSVDGCEGAPFTVTATIRPEPVVDDINAVSCSDVTFGGQTQLPNGGTNIGVSQWNFESLVLGSPLTSPFPGGTTNNPANYPFTLSNTGIGGFANRASINNDAFNNIGSFDANAVYSIIPIGTDPPGPLAGCVGDTFFVTGVIHPEPLGISLAPVEQCSGVPFEINLNDYLTNITPDPDSLEPVSYVITGITQSPIALVVVNSQGIVDSILSITATNFATLPITLNVSIQPTSRFGCVGSNFIVPIIINNNPDVSLSPNGDNTLCEGESRTLQGSVVPNISPASYNFEYTITAGTGTLTNANTISATVTATTGPLTVQFKATNPTTGCSDSISFTFTVNPNPTFTTVADTIFGCAVVPNGAQGVFYLPNGASAGSGTLTFHVSESDANAGIGAIGNPTNYTGNNNQEIWVRLTGVNGCYIVDDFILSVSTLPNAVITGTLAYCDGESTTLIASGGDFYSWNDINNTNSDTLIVTEPGTYTVTVTDDIGCSATASVTVTEHPKPNASITASETAVCYGESITLTANGGEVVEWSTGGSDNPIIFFPEVGDSTVSVVVENVFGCLDTASIILTGYPIPDPILVNNLDTCALTFGGNTAEFDLATTSDSTLTFHLTESDAQAGLGAIVNPNSFTGTNGQLIWWSYVDGNGCIAIGSFELIVNPLPTVLASADESAICLGADVTLEASAPMGSIYLWSPGGQTVATFVDTPAVTTTYTVVVTDLNGCINSSEVTVTVNPNPAGTITGTDGIECEGTTVTLVAGGGDAYEWLNGVGNTSAVDVTITSDTTFTVVVTNAFGCTDTTSVDIDLSPELIWDSTNVVNVTCNGGSDGEVYALATGGTAPLTYAWEDGDANSIGSSSSVTGLDAGSYHLTVTDDEGCSITVTLQVTEPDALQIVAIVSNNLECNGDSTGNTSGTILGGVGPYTIYIEGSSYLDSLDDPSGFYFENLAADTYTVTAVDSNGCEVSVNIEITEPTPLLISATPIDATCNGGNGTVTVFGSGGTPGYTYFVNFPAPNTPANSPSFSVPAGTYTVHIEDTHSCRDSVEVTIGEPTAVVVDSIIATNESCDGANDGTATAYVSGGTPGYTYSWSNAQSTSIATGLGEGTYYVTITDINGCEVIDSVEIGVNAPAPPVVLNCPTDITLYVQDCDISYSWLAPTIVDNCLTTQLTVDLDGAENEGFTLGIQQVNFEPGVFNITYTDETADPDTIACEFTVTVIDTIVPVIVCPDTVQVQCVEDIPAYYTNYLDFIADGGILDDNCTVSLSTFAWVSDTGLLAPECTNRDTISRIYSVEDIYGNTGLCEQTIVVYDTIAPTITLPSDTIVNCDAIMTPAQLGSATAEDNCEQGSVNITWADNSTQSGDVDSCDNYNYVITRTWYAEDECGNIDSLDQTIMVQDTTKPVAICKNFFVYLDTNGEASILPDSINNVSTDNCMPSASLNLALDVQDFDCDDVPSVEVTLFVKDACGNTNSCTAIVTVADTVAPVAVCQTAITIYLDDLGNVSIDSTDIDNGSSDNCAIKNMILSDSEFDCDDVSTSPNVVEMYVIDFYNNADTCSTNVTVLDTIRPEALCQDITVQLDGTGNVSITAGMINNGSNDACGLDTMTVTPNAFDCTNLNTNTVTLTVTDVNGNTQTCTAVVTVLDTLDPVAICANITVSLDSASGEYTLTSLDSTNIVSTSSDNCSFVATFTPSEFDCDDVFAPVSVLVTLTDPSNNTDTCSALVTVNDVTDPTPACADLTVELDSLTGVYVLNAADSTDIVNNTFDACGFTTEFSQDTFTCADALSPVSVTVTYTDPSNNTSTCVVDVTVEDNFAPAPQCSDYTVELDSASGQYILNALDSSEIVDGTFDACGFTADFSRDTFYCSDALAPVTITVTYEDPTGNLSTCTAVITVEDNFAPTPQCSDYTVELDSATGLYILNAIDSSEIVDGTFDACGFVTDFSRDTFNCLDVFAPVTITVTYEDPSGNISTCTADITVDDVTAPTAVCNDITVSLDSTGNYTLTSTDKDNIVAGSFDACSYTYVLDTLSFTCGDVGTNNVTATFTDPSNNTSNCVSVVTVTDTIAPVIVCQDTTIYLDSLGEASITAEELVVSAIDACGIDTMTITQTDFTCADIAGPFNEVITVTDVNGNSKTCSVIVTVVDSLAPWFTECKVDTVMNTSPTSCFAPYASIYFAPIEDNCTPSNAIIVTSTAKVISSGQIINMVVAPINGGIDGYNLSVPGLFGFSLPVGPNLLTVYATDGQGNIDSCQWTVQVNDVWAPSLQNCPSNVTVNVNPITCVGQAFWGGPTASDNCSGVSLMTQNNNQWFSGAFFPLGTTTVVYTATDNSGNTTTCSFDVIVNGTCTPNVDLTPVYVGSPGTFAPGQTRDVVVRIRNIGTDPTTGVVQFFIPKVPGFTMLFSNAQTTADVSSGTISVDNPDWNVTVLGTGLLMKLNVGAPAIAAGDSDFVAIQVTGVTPGASGMMTSTLSNGTGGDINSTNNSRVKSLSVSN